MDPRDIYRTFHSTVAKYTFFSNPRGTFSRLNHVIDHKASLSKFKEAEIIPSIFCDHNGIN